MRQELLVSQRDPQSTLALDEPFALEVPAEPDAPLVLDTEAEADNVVEGEVSAPPSRCRDWLTDKAVQARARREDERVPSEVYYAALGQFFSDGWIKDVQMLVQSGKEATVYCCEAQPGTGHALLAAKVYRPAGVRHNRNPQAAYDEASLRRTFESKVKVRTFAWDARYREGRTIGDSRFGAPLSDEHAPASRSRTTRGREVSSRRCAVSTPHMRTSQNHLPRLATPS